MECGLFTAAVSLNYAEFLEIFLKLVIKLGRYGLLVTSVGHEYAAVQILSFIEENVCRVDVHLVLTNLLRT